MVGIAARLLFRILGGVLRLVSRSADGLLHPLLQVLASLLHAALRLVELALVLGVLIAGHGAGSFLHFALQLVHLTSHCVVSFSGRRAWSRSGWCGTPSGRGRE